MQWHVETYDSVASTQDTVLERLRDEALAEGYVLQALEQKGGKGRHGRSWDSPPGNLYCSFVLQPKIDARDLGQLSLMVAVALARAVERFSETRPALKWPNDVLLGGRKCAGILLNNDPQAKAVVVGVGVNLAYAPDYGACVQAPVDDFRDAFLEQVAALYGQDFAPVRQLWLAYAHKKGTVLRVQRDAGAVEGVFVDLDAQGNLVLNVDGIMQTFSSGDVFLQEGPADVAGD